MATAEDLADLLPDRPLDLADLATLESRDGVERVVSVALRPVDGGTFVDGLQIEVGGGLVYLADLEERTWAIERYTGANLWWLREERDERVDERA